MRQDKVIENIHGEQFTVDQLRSKQNLERFLNCSRDSLNRMLNPLANSGLIREHLGRRQFNNRELKIILDRLDGTDITNDAE